MQMVFHLLEIIIVHIDKREEQTYTDLLLFHMLIINLLEGELFRKRNNLMKLLYSDILSLVSNSFFWRWWLFTIGLIKHLFA